MSAVAGRRMGDKIARILLNANYEPCREGMKKFLEENIEMFSVREIAEILGIPSSTVQMYIKSLHIKNPRLPSSKHILDSFIFWSTA